MNLRVLPRDPHHAERVLRYMTEHELTLAANLAQELDWFIAHSRSRHKGIAEMLREKLRQEER